MDNPLSSHFLQTSDQVKLHYLKGGNGMPTIMLPGGGFSVGIFKEQYSDLCNSYNLIALDQRGHGESDKPDYGYRVARLAKDLEELIQHLNVETYNLIGHSLGASVIYQYLDLFDNNRVNKMILIDEPCILLHDPSWPEEKVQQLGAIYDPSTLHAMLNRFTSPDVSQFKQDIIALMTTTSASSALKTHLMQCMTLSNQAATKLYFNNICQDYRDILAKIDRPVLYITGKASLHPWQSHQWMAEQVKHSQLEIFSENEGGSHFMFIENPLKFNQIVLNFLNE